MKTPTGKMSKLHQTENIYVPVFLDCGNRRPNGEILICIHLSGLKVINNKFCVDCLQIYIPL